MGGRKKREEVCEPSSRFCFSWVDLQGGADEMIPIIRAIFDQLMQLVIDTISHTDDMVV